MQYKIIYSKRKTVSIQVKPDGSIMVRAPQGTDRAVIDRFVTSKASWIEESLRKMQAVNRVKQSRPSLTVGKRKEIITLATKLIPIKVEEYARIIGVSYGRITIRNQKTRWGSCSSKGNLNFNYMIAAMPEPILDYVVVHELCHRKQMNHSKAFWAEVKKVLPDYEERRKWLKLHGSEYSDH